MGLPGKPDGMSSAEVEKYFRDGHVREIAEYCESDVLNTYRYGSVTNSFAGPYPMRSFKPARRA
jgi:predicted PolB exonuclease-like 3'-5' exonuclease